MVTKIMPLTREAGVELLIQQAPIAPKQRSHTYEDDIAVLWYVGEQIVHLKLEPGDTRGRWLSWHPSEHPNIKNTFQYLDITNPETWHSLLSELQC